MVVPVQEVDCGATKRGVVLLLCGHREDGLEW